MIKSDNTNRLRTIEGELTLYGVFNVYQREIAENWCWNDNTLAQYLSMLLNTIIPCIEDHNMRPIGAYTPDYIDSRVKRIDAIKYQKEGKGYKTETLKKFRHIMDVTVRTAILHMLCPDVWVKNTKGSIRSKYAQVEKNKPVRYFTPTDDLRIIRYIKERTLKSGEMRGLYIMMCTRCRENEAAGITWEMIRDNEDNPKHLTVSFLQTTQLMSADTKFGGKTNNAPRQVTLTLEESEYIRNIRSQLEERWINKGGSLSTFGRMRVAIRKNKPGDACRARHLSEAANNMFAELNMYDAMADLNRSLANESIEYVENPDYWEVPPETSATCYTLRRAAATFDRVLGIDLHDRQYLMGHAVANMPYSHIFVDAYYQCLIAQQSADRPGLNTIQPRTTTLDGVLELQDAYHDIVLASFDNGRIVGQIRTEEPGDRLHLVVNSTVPCKIIINSSVNNPPRKKEPWNVNVKRKLHEMYANAEEELELCDLH